MEVEEERRCREGLLARLSGAAASGEHESRVIERSGEMTYEADAGSAQTHLLRHLQALV